jgi:hypothetical protein
MMKRHLCLFIFLLSLLSIQAQNKVLMPTTIREANETEKVLLKPNNQFAFLSLPSFAVWEDRGLSFDYASMTLTLRITREPTTKEYDTKPDYPWHNQYELKVDKIMADALFSLFTAAIYSASSIVDDALLMDGCLYIFQIGGMYKGITRSPDAESNCGRLVKIVKKVCHCDKNQDKASLKLSLNEIYALTDIFISHYPLEVPEAQWKIYDIHKRYKVKGPSVGLVF